MCLIDTQKLRISSEKIIIYKIVENKFGKLQAPYQHLEYKTFPVIENTKEIEPTITQQNTFQYGYGFIHAYLNEEIAKTYLNMLRSLPCSRIFNIYKGYIQPDTRIGISVNNDSICAKKIFLTDELCVY